MQQTKVNPDVMILHRMDHSVPASFSPIEKRPIVGRRKGASVSNGGTEGGSNPRAAELSRRKSTSHPDLRVSPHRPAVARFVAGIVPHCADALRVARASVAGCCEPRSLPDQ